MRKLFLILLVACVLFIQAAPALAKGSGNPQTGDPPGWSHENPGSGGSENPGPGGD